MEIESGERERIQIPLGRRPFVGCLRRIRFNEFLEARVVQPPRV